VSRAGPRLGELTPSAATVRTASVDGYLPARRITGSSLSMFGQAIGELNPGQLILYPSMVGWRNCFRMVESGNGHIDFVCVRFCHKR
jgi:hypothetical protein